MTKIEMGILGPGSFYLPKGVLLYCPRCGVECAENGECTIKIVADKIGNNGFSLNVDCKVCGCNRLEPSVHKITPTEL
ncbi:MAG: hypothetical protein KKE05_05370 [Nanoarchaeota archaeon]|nr:hypothetical protein [Nanoarchaeota archaeon]